MIRAWLRYSLLFVLGSALYIFYVGYTSYFLFLFILSLPIISLILYVIGTWRFELQIHCANTKIYKGNTQEISLRSRTKVWVPLAKVTATIHIQNHFHNTMTSETLGFTSECEYTDVVIPCEFSTCGKYTISIQTVHTYDILHLFKRKKNYSSTLDIYVLPSPALMQEELVFTPQLGEEEFDKNRPGNDPGETFDVHEYRDGDSLHKVHWKLSAKLDTLMVRETSMPIAKHAKLYFDLYGSSLDADRILGQVYGCSIQLLAGFHEHDILQYEAGLCVKEVHITNKEELIDFLCGILSKRANMSATSSIDNIFLQEDALLVQKNRVISHALQKGGEQHASAK